MKKTTVHGTCVALGGAGALIRGSCGSGKSDLALRFLYLPAERLGAAPALIADDQVILRRDGDRILASCPPRIAGKIEVRGCGIADVAGTIREAELKVVVNLDWTGDRPRLPEKAEWETVLDVPVRSVLIDPFELSAPIKLALAIQGGFESRWINKLS
jgi:serine kinase of HPr protein (carbohydrate metabolism regulator)